MSGEAPESGGGQPPTDPHAALQIPTSIHAFISYASQDAAVAHAIVAALERHGLKCWIAPQDVIPGSLYADGIVRAISGAKVFALMLSEHAIASSHVGKEIALALQTLGVWQQLHGCERRTISLYLRSACSATCRCDRRPRSRA